MLALERNSTNFPMQIYEYLSKCKKEIEAAETADAKKYAFLKYHQNIVRAYITNILVDTRGLLVYHTMGMGKSIMGVAIAFELMEKTSAEVIVLLTKSLQENFKKGILKYIGLRSTADPSWKYAGMDSGQINAFIAKKFSFVSMNASNMISQLSAAATRDDTRGGECSSPQKASLFGGEGGFDTESTVTGGVGKNAITGGVGKNAITSGKTDYLIKTLNGKCLIVDEAHNLFRAITNGSQNAKALYDIVMSSRTVKVVFLTGTPISNDPFELVPCFNMLAPYGIGTMGTKNNNLREHAKEHHTLFPEVWKDFYRDFVDISAGTIKNKGKFQNRIMGLVSHVSHLSFAATKGAKSLSTVEFPEELPTVIEFVPMEQHQYLLYQLAREREKEESKRGKQNPFAQTPLMQKPKSEVSSSYRQKTRQISNFCPEYFSRGDLEKRADSKFLPENGEVSNKPIPTFLDQKYSEIDVDKIPINMVESKKFDAILKNINNSPGNGYVYSQFVGAGGIGSFRRYLEKHGWELCDFQKKIGLGSHAVKTSHDAKKPSLLSRVTDVVKSSDKTAELIVTTTDSYPSSADNPLGEDEEEIKEEITAEDNQEHLNTVPTPVAEQEKLGGLNTLNKLNKLNIQNTLNIPNRYAEPSGVSLISSEIESAFLKEMKKTEKEEQRQIDRYFSMFPAVGKSKFGGEHDTSGEIVSNENIFEITEDDLINPSGVLENFSNETHYNCHDSFCQLWKPSQSTNTKNNEDQKHILIKIGGFVYKVNGIPTSCIVLDIQDNDIQLVYINGHKNEISLMMEKLQKFYIENEREVINVIMNDIIFAKRAELIRSVGFIKLGPSLWQFNLRNPRISAENQSNNFRSFKTKYGAKDIIFGSKGPEHVSGAPQPKSGLVDSQTDTKIRQPDPKIHQPDTKKRQSGPKKYAIISGEVAVEHRQQIENILNSPENKHGGIIDLVLISSTGAEGLDFKNMRHVHIMEPYWNYARLLQIGYRGNRNDSHIALDKHDRNIRMYIYLAVKPTQETGVITQLEYNKMLEGAIEGKTTAIIDEYMTTDLELYITSVKDYKPIGSFLRALQEASIECAVNNADAEGGIVAHCRMCDPTGSVLYYDDISQDLKASDPCVPFVEKKITADEVALDGKTYYYVADDSSIFGYAVFLLDEKIGKYVRMPEDDPRFVKIVEILKSKK